MRAVATLVTAVAVLQGSRVTGVTADEVAEAELLELSFRSSLHAAALEQMASHLDKAHTSATAAGEAVAHAAAHAGWRDGGHYSPQQWGQWRMARGTWAFTGDRQAECGACVYVLSALIDRLGDQFSRVTIEQEAELLCPRVSWVYKSACDFVVRKNKAVVADMVMKLMEPVDQCKHLTLCPPNWYDLMGVGGMNGYGPPPQYRGAYGLGGGGSAVPAAPPPGILPPPWASPYGGAYANSMWGGYPSGGYDIYGAGVAGGGNAAGGSKPSTATTTAATGGGSAGGGGGEGGAATTG